MSIQKLWFAACIAAAAAAALAAASPAPVRRDLSDVLNRTVCPIRVEVDEDPARVPRRIKLLKCAPEPTRWCRRQGVPDNECCSHAHADRVMQCAEIVDTVLVRYPATGATAPYQVEVGCTCLISRSSRAEPAT